MPAEENPPVGKRRSTHWYLEESVLRTNSIPIVGKDFAKLREPEEKKRKPSSSDNYPEDNQYNGHSVRHGSPPLFDGDTLYYITQLNITVHQIHYAKILCT